MKINKLFVLAVAVISIAQLHGSTSFTDGIFPSDIKRVVGHLTKGDPILAAAVMARISQAQDKEAWSGLQYSPQKVQALVDHVKETDYKGSPSQWKYKISQLRKKRAALDLKMRKQRFLKRFGFQAEWQNLENYAQELENLQDAYQDLLDEQQSAKSDGKELI